MTIPMVLTEMNGRQLFTITLNRPEKGNACDDHLLGLLSQAINRAVADPAVRVVALRGNGRHFCTGRDLSSLPSSSADPRGKVELNDSLLNACDLLDAAPKPTIAVVRGACTGAGVALAACCDFVLASENSFFALPETRIGLAPGPASLIISRTIGHRALRRLLVSGERFNAQTARTLQLVHEVSPDAKIETALANIVEAFLMGGPKSQAAAKALMRAFAGPMSGAEFDRAAVAFRRHATSSEADEGMAAFRAKRLPSWYSTPREEKD